METCYIYPTTSDNTELAMLHARSCRGDSGVVAACFMGTLLALALTLYASIQCPMWFDEYFSLKMISGGWSQIAPRANVDVHPPLYYLYLFAWERMLSVMGGAGAAPRFIRLSSILPTAAAAVLLARWAWRSDEPRAAIPVLLGYMLSGPMLFYSIELRNYSLLCLAVLASTLVLASALENDRWQSWIGLSIISLLGMGLHYVYALIVASQICFVVYRLLRRRNDECCTRRPWIRVFGLFLLPQAMMLAAQVGITCHKFIRFYAPYNAYLPTAKLTSLPEVLLYHYWNLTPFANPLRPRAWITRGMAFAIYLILAIGFRRIAQGTLRGLPPLIPLATWTLGCYLGVLWLIGYGSRFAWFPGQTEMKVFSGYRTAVLTFPLWYVLMHWLIGHLKTRHTLALRWGLLAVLLALAPQTIVTRMERMDDLQFLRGYLEVKGAISCCHLLVEDPELSRWLHGQDSRLPFQSLEEWSRKVPAAVGDALICVHNVSDLRMRTPSDARRMKFLEDWASRHRSPWMNYGPVRVLAVPADDFVAFQTGLKQLQGG